MAIINPKEALELELALCRDNLALFIEKTFEIINPGTEYIYNWHIHCLAEYLTACKNRQIKRLIINVPPRSLKSVSTNVAFPAWLLGHEPTTKIMSASYSLDLSLKHSVDCRMLMQSDWYQMCFPGTKIASDQNEKSKFMTTRRGERFATSVGATTTGAGGEFLICDDAHSQDQAQSDTIRESQVEWFDRSFMTRMNSKERDVVIVIMQRLHNNDLTGHLLKKGGWTHLCLPALFEKPRTISIGNFKKEIKAGEYLQPGREAKKVLDQLRRDLGEYAFYGQFMQNPVPEGGGIIKQKWFELWPAGKKLPRFSYVMQVWDTAFTEKSSGDPSACITLGIFFPDMDDDEKEKLQNAGGGFAVMLIDCESERLGFPALRKKIIEMRSYRYGEQEKAVDMVLVEDKASGQSIIQELKNANLPVKAFKVGRMDKTSRLHSISHFIENGLFYIPESTKRPGEFRDWAMEFVTQVCSFPAAEHDDYVDCLSSSLITLSQMTFLRLQSIAEDIDEDLERTDPFAGANAVNPYGV